MLTTNDVLPCTHVNPFDPTDHETPDEATQWHCPDCGYDCEIPLQDNVIDFNYTCPDCFADECLEFDVSLSDTISRVHARFVVSAEEAREIASEAFYRVFPMLEIEQCPPLTAAGFAGESNVHPVFAGILSGIKSWPNVFGGGK